MAIDKNAIEAVRARFRNASYDATGSSRLALAYRDAAALANALWYVLDDRPLVAEQLLKTEGLIHE